MGCSGALQQEKERDKSWMAWNRFSLAPIRKAPASVKLVLLLASVPRLAITAGSISALQVAEGRLPSVIFGLCLLMFWAGVFILFFLRKYIAATTGLSERRRYMANAILTLTMIIGSIALVYSHTKADEDAFTNIVVVLMGVVSVSQFIVQFLSYFGHFCTCGGFALDGNNDFSDFFYQVNDFVVAMFVFTLIFTFSILPVASFQSLMLFNRAFSRDLRKERRRRTILGSILSDPMARNSCLPN
ncbi:hypothetical protein CYMTET_4036 [Cymbomonas tetramitiformis]|uniref:Uncharacterized protein n=1 Tax=Cymbomonas tetramitiformis TaxID=36881 RepID=A0AAE0LKW0_9CHLO|nr:hypothetical protein CYMTET_4036 [Cymbomonas tetramitiformis]